MHQVLIYHLCKVFFQLLQQYYPVFELSWLLPELVLEVHLKQEEGCQHIFHELLISRLLLKIMINHRDEGIYQMLQKLLDWIANY